MRILVTGHRGYIGSVLTAVLRHGRHEVYGLDAGFYAGCEFGRTREEVPSYDTDVRDIEFTDLLPFDAVVHLADVPTDASIDPDGSLSTDIIERGTVRLADCCRQAGVSRLVYVSTCKVYGRRRGRVDEGDRPVPVTRHAAAKLAAERAIQQMATDRFVPVILRCPEAFGVSPALHLDSPTNEFVASAITTGMVRMPSDGREWHAAVHVEDFARVCVAVLAASAEVVSRNIFNVVPPGPADRVIDIADAVVELVPQSQRVPGLVRFDGPSCRVDGGRFAIAFPDFKFRWSLRSGIRQLRAAMLGIGLTPSDYRGDRLRRRSRLWTLMNRGELDASLRVASQGLAVRPMGLNGRSKRSGSPRSPHRRAPETCAQTR